MRRLVVLLQAVVAFHRFRSAGQSRVVAVVVCRRRVGAVVVVVVVVVEIVAFVVGVVVVDARRCPVVRPVVGRVVPVVASCVI
jgi:hypothetical protein